MHVIVHLISYTQRVIMKQRGKSSNVKDEDEDVIYWWLATISLYQFKNLIIQDSHEFTRSAAEVFKSL